MRSSADRPLRVFFIPFPSPGHMNPMLDMAKLFAGRGVAATVLTTPGNEHLLRPAIDRANTSSSARHPIHLLLLPFPSTVTHLLPAGQENLAAMPSSDFMSFMNALFALQQPMDDLLLAHRPDCIVSDTNFSWTAATAERISIPRLVFHGHGLFAQCVHESVELHRPHKLVSHDHQPFHVTGLPHEIQLTVAELSAAFLYDDWLAGKREAEERSYGVVFNTFRDLEPDYAVHYRNKPGRRAWYIGPVSLCSGDATEAGGDVMGWLDSMEAGSVVYVSFGSLAELSAGQLRELALGLEASGHPFILVVRDIGGSSGAWRPEGFEERVEGRGVVVEGWAPQLAILNHAAVGGFVTHCGWNSTLEALCAGVPMITWPREYEQFVNERLITRVLEVGTGVAGRAGEVKRAAEIAAAVARVMGDGVEAEGMRRRAREYAGKARVAVGDGGSSHADLTGLIDELERRRRGGFGDDDSNEGVV